MEQPAHHPPEEHHETTRPEPALPSQPPAGPASGRRMLVVFGIIGLLALLGVALVVFMLNRPADNQAITPQPNQATNVTPREAAEAGVIWESMGDGKWAVQGGKKAPACPTAVLTQSPADVSKATAVLYPGQVRGGNYKPHGGLRFAAAESVTVKMPFDGSVYRGSQYIEAGEVQYLFDIIHPCGFMVRFDHIRTPSDVFKAIASKFPAPTESSQTTRLDQPVLIKAGDSVATAVGFAKTGNNSFDFGLYDLRDFNDASKSAAFQQAHPNDKELAWHGLCWLTMLPGGDAAKAKALPPGDQAQGAKSDYCK